MTTSPSGPAPAPNAPFTAMLRGALLPSIAAGLVAVVVLWVMRQSRGGLGGLLGVAVAVVFFAAGLYVMKRVVGANPLSVLAGALAVYLGQIIFLGIIILVLAERAVAGRHRLRARHPRRSRWSGRPARWSPSCGCVRASTTRRPASRRGPPPGAATGDGEGDSPAAGRAPGEGR